MNVNQISKKLIKIFTVDINSPYFSAVKKLWQSNSAVPGHFPEQAFEHFAQNGLILGALDGQDHFVGYLLYRLCPMKGKASVVHVCVESVYRRNGVCGALIEHVKEKTQGLQGISLLCREGQQWEQIWSGLGFAELKTTLHHSWDKNPLHLWWYDHGHPAVVSSGKKSSERLSVVLDADVLYALQDRQATEQEDAQAMLADWLQESIVLCLTDETFFTINRSNDRLEREYRRAFGGKFCRIATEQNAVRAVNQQLERMFAFSIKDNDES